MTEQQIDRDRLRASAESALACGAFDGDVLSAVPALLDALDQAEAELDSWMTRAYEAEKRAWQAEKRLAGWMEHWNATARTGAVDEVAAILDANTRADQAEARIRHLEGTARVLAKEALTAEDVRDEHRRGKAAAEARVAEEKRLRMKATAAATKAEARIKAVEDVLDTEEARPRPIGGGYDKRALVRIADIRRALEG